MSNIRSIGILGAGRAGTALARASAAAGITVQIAASRAPSQLKYHLMQYAPQATAVEVARIAMGADLVVLMVPQEDLDDVDVASLSDAILVDATNRWQDEPLPEWLETSLAGGLSSSEAISAHFATARIVKALNHISHWDLDSDRAAKLDSQRALAIAADNPHDAAIVSTLIEQLGFSPVILTSLADGSHLEPEGRIFNEVLDAQSLRRLTEDPTP